MLCHSTEQLSSRHLPSEDRDTRTSSNTHHIHPTSGHKSWLIRSNRYRIIIRPIITSSRIGCGKIRWLTREPGSQRCRDMIHTAVRELISSTPKKDPVRGQIWLRESATSYGNNSACSQKIPRQGIANLTQKGSTRSHFHNDIGYQISPSFLVKTTPQRSSTSANL